MRGSLGAAGADQTLYLRGCSDIQELLVVIAFSSDCILIKASEDDTGFFDRDRRQLFEILNCLLDRSLHQLGGERFIPKARSCSQPCRGPFGPHCSTHDWCNPATL